MDKKLEIQSKKYRGETTVISSRVPVDLLDINSKCAEAYLGFAMIEKRASTLEELFAEDIPESKNYQRAKQFADEILADKFNDFEQPIILKIKIQEEARIRKEKQLKGIREKLSVVKNIIFTESRHTVGLKSNGTVVAVGDNYHGRCNVSEWRDIVAVSAGYSYTVGLKSDGTVVAVGNNEDGNTTKR